MGRIGRTFFRVLHEAGELTKLAAINDIMPKKHLVYLLQYDTVRGHLSSRVTETPDGIEVDGHKIKVFNAKRPIAIPWRESGVSIAIEATGKFTNSESLSEHLEAGAKYSILTTTGGEKVPLFITGVNENEYNNEQSFSIGSCTVNGSAPLLRILEPLKPSSVYLNVIHAYSARQNILDSYYPEIRRSRASADNIIPLNINLDLSLQRLFPALENKIKSITSRVPIPCGVLSDMTVMLDNPPKSNEELMEFLQENILSVGKGVAQITNDPIVSSDVLHNPHSLIIDGEFAHIMGNHAKLLVWFDNEWGFSNRLLDWVRKLV